MVEVVTARPYRDAFAGAREPIATLRPDGTFEHGNRAFEDLFGSFDSDLGFQFQDLFDDDELSGGLDTTRAGHEWTHDLAIAYRSGDRREPVRVSFVPVTSVEGEGIVRIVASVVPLPK